MNYIDRTFLPRIDLAREADFAIGGLCVRPSRREAEVGGVRLVLQRRVMQVLVALAHPSAEVVSQDELISRCWGGLAVGEDAVGRCIGQLRRLAAQWPAPPFEIVTISGVGYRLDPAGPGAAQANRQSAGPAPVRRLDRRGLILAGGAVALVALAAAVGIALTRGAGARPASRVVVAPFQTLSDRPEVRFLARRVGDELLGVLSTNQVEALSRADAGLKEEASPQEAARRGVGLILDGSVQDEGGAARVVVRLVDAQTRVNLWSAQFDRPSGAATDLPAEVSARTADIVQIAEFARTASPPLKDDAALSALLGSHDLVRWDQSHNWARQVALAQQVVKAAPEFGFGHSMLATAYAYAVRWNAMPQQRAEFVADVKSEAASALAVDPHDAAAYFALTHVADGYAAREAVLAKGLSVSTHPAAPLGALNNAEGQLLWSVGRLRDSLPFVQRSVALDPLSPGKVVTEVYAYAEVGRQAEAREVLADGVKRWPNHPEMRTGRLTFLTFSDRPEAALAVLDDPSAAPADLAPEAAGAWRAYLTAMRTGQPRLKTQAARALAAIADRGAFDRRIAALMLARLGALDLAFAQAGRVAGPSGDPRFLFRAAEAMQRDARFMPLAARFGLVDYWRTTGKWPDFCAQPGLPYDCKTEAAKLAAGVRQGLAS